MTKKGRSILFEFMSITGIYCKLNLKKLGPIEVFSIYRVCKDGHFLLLAQKDDYFIK